jgi:hypothetical protein
MRVWVYKRTHLDDPSQETGVFGCHQCMRSVRGWPSRKSLGAIIGIGGKIHEVRSERLKLSWVGKGVHYFNILEDFGEEVWRLHKRCLPPRHEPTIMAFDHFAYRENGFDLLEKIAPCLANYAYSSKVWPLPGIIVDSSNPERRQEQEIEEIFRRTEVDGACHSPSLHELEEIKSRRMSGDSKKIIRLMG